MLNLSGGNRILLNSFLLIMGIGNNIWVFLSHSNKDYDRVCQVRNYLEKKHYRPLMFFLNCIDDSDELDSLIKREIDSRERFILCNSSNARESSWVQREVEYIKSKKRVYAEIDLEGTWDQIVTAIEKYSENISVYLSYQKDAEGIAGSVRDYLRSNHFFCNDYTLNNHPHFEDLEDLKIFHSSILNSIVRGLTVFITSSFASYIESLLNLQLLMEYHGNQWMNKCLFVVNRDIPEAKELIENPTLNVIVYDSFLTESNLNDIKSKLESLCAPPC